jgi:hypothetical protein
VNNWDPAGNRIKHPIVSVFDITLSELDTINPAEPHSWFPITRVY